MKHSILRRLSSSRPCSTLVKSSYGRRLKAERLEDRHLLTAVTVNSLDDLPVDLSDNIVTLRDAIHAASNDVAVSPGGPIGSGADTITFDPSLTVTGDATVSLSIFDTGLDGGPAATSEFGATAFIIRAEAAGNNDITIEGPSGDNGITIERNGSSSNFRLFHVQQNQSLTLKNLTLSGGIAKGGSVEDQYTGGASAGMGGGIFNQGNLIVQNSLLTGNTAAGGDWDDVGLYASAGASVGSTISDSNRYGGGPNVGASPGGNGGFGGGGAAGGGLAGNGGFGAGGGGGFYDGYSPSNSRAGGNGGFGAGGGGGASGISDAPGMSGFGAQAANFTSPGAGAGMGGAVFNAGGTLTITNSTVSSNSATGGVGQFDAASGMGAGVFSRNGSITSLNSTFANNTVANGDAGGAALFLVADGSGGADSMGTGITAQIDNTIFADSTGGSDTTFVTLSGGTSTIAGVTNIIGTNDVVNPLVIGVVLDSGNSLLDPLADNGGPTHTHGISLTSLAFNQGSNGPATAAGLTADQRGLTRISIGQVDIGAFEFQGETQSLIVDTTIDIDNPFDDQTSLREAIVYANSLTGADTITFSSLFDSAQTINLSSQLPTITDSVTITGPGADKLTIEASPNSRHLNIDDGVFGTQQTVNISGLTLSGGNVVGDGGAILNREHLTVTDSVLSGNTASSDGGAINNYYGTLTLNGNTFSGNEAGSKGGGIHSYGGSLNVDRSTIVGNNASNGGGIYLYGPGTVTNSTISGNVVTGSGGGIYNSFALLTVSGSTISGNMAGDRGGGITTNDGPMQVFNSTVTENRAPNGGGLHTQGSGGHLELNSSIVANSLLGNDILHNGNVLSGDLNLVEDGIGVGPLTNTITGDPLLDALANNGGPTQTHALLVGSPAIDMGSASTPFDQRGFGFFRFAGAGHDIGAFEKQLDAIFTVTITDDEIDAADTNPATYNPADLSLREAVSLSNFDPTTNDSIQFAAGSGDDFENGGLIRLTLGEIEITDGVTIDASAVGGEVIITGDANDDDVTVDLEYSAGPVSIVNPTEITNVEASYGGTPGALDDLLDDNSRVFNITSTTAATIINGLTITGGRTTGTADSGGGILSAADLTLIDSSVSGNSTAGTTASGGGIASNGSLRIVESTVSQNVATSNGGGIQATAGSTTTVIDSALFGNSATSGFGGAIFGQPNTTVNVTNTTLAANSAANGSAIASVTGGSVLLTNSTVTGNYSADGSTIHGVTNTLTLANSVILGNSLFTGSEIVSVGGATQTVTGPTIVGTNLLHVGGSSTSLGGSVLDVSASVFAETIDYINTNGDDVRQPLELTTSDGAIAGNLSSNGETVLTVALSSNPSNPALDAGLDNRLSESVVGIDLNGDGDTSDSIDTDARSEIRLIDQTVANNGLNLVDLGAYETAQPSADFDSDGDVDGGDFLTWQRGFGTLAPFGTKTNGDANNDTAVDADDLTVWQGQYGQISVVELAALSDFALEVSNSLPLNRKASAESATTTAATGGATSIVPSRHELVDLVMAFAQQSQADYVLEAKASLSHSAGGDGSEWSDLRSQSVPPADLLGNRSERTQTSLRKEQAIKALENKDEFQWLDDELLGRVLT